MWFRYAYYSTITFIFEQIRRLRKKIAFKINKCGIIIGRCNGVINVIKKKDRNIIENHDQIQWNKYFIKF